MVTAMTLSKLVHNGLAVMLCCLMLTACNTSNFSGGVSSGVPSQNVGSNDPALAQNAEQDLTVGESALVAANNESAATQLQQPGVQQPNTQLASVPDSAPASFGGPGIAFLPVTGAPQSSVTALSNSLKNAASANKINLIPFGSGNAKYRVKGYFSALDDGSGTRLVYVWDVLDASGSRLHRISGQQHSSKKSTNPWSAVSEGQIRQLASDTMGQLKTWLAKR